ncbi:uncharacterized protein BYT42DRAFT_547923 [Radiomyces spectabilis]|uniref:uncharacterized protein n=1 Tax=Radiomyces spectabilis TaxID=64574 RepID=UPI00221FB083|nr:uncharacterized protein BYT42DRAFT_547923 [Radiomyces spectabilis]KAI8372889.1 hypothetical protein BYT42DRAFT_547923 [Radiomyces spectabilis]
MTNDANVFYYKPGSTFSNIGLLNLLEKQVIDRFTLQKVELARGENNEPWYIQVNSKGLVPVLVHNGKATAETIDIGQYLDKQFPDHPLHADDAQVIEKLQRWHAIQLKVIALGPKSADENTDKRAADLKAERDSIEKNAQANPALAAAYTERLNLFDARAQGIMSFERQQQQTQLWAKLLEDTDNYLADGREYLHGSTFTLLDLHAVAMLYAAQTKWRLEVPADRPHVKSYYERHTQRPAFVKLVQMNTAAN